MANSNSSVAIQLANSTTLVNYDYHNNIVDLCWPRKGEDNLSLRKFSEINVYESGKQVQPELGRPRIVNDQIEYSYKYNTRTVNLISNPNLVSDGLISNKYNLSNPSETDIAELTFYVCTRPDFGNNRSRDTAVYHNDLAGIVHYEDDTYLGVFASFIPENYACHSPQDNFGRGALPDKDLQLTGNPVATGEVESCLEYRVKLMPGETQELEIYYLFAHDLEELLRKSKHIEIEAAPASTDLAKLDKSIDKLSQRLDLDSDMQQRLSLAAHTSAQIVSGSFTNAGGSFAAIDSGFYKDEGTDDYGYFWPRDGAITILAHAKFCEFDNLKPTADRYYNYLLKCFKDKPYLEHRYRLNDAASLASSWYPWDESIASPLERLQLDQTAINLFIYTELLRMYNYRHQRFELLIPDIARFLISCLDKDTGIHSPCYDTWENDYDHFTATQAAVIAGLKAARTVIANFAPNPNYTELTTKIDHAIELGLRGLTEKLTENGHFIRGIKVSSQGEKRADYRTDASTHFVWILKALPESHPLVEKTTEKLRSELEVGKGFARYNQDNYLRVTDDFPGNPWYISTLWFAQYAAASGDDEALKSALSWVLEHMESTGLLPEMADPISGYALSVRPLVWSHAEVLNLLHLI